MPQDANVIANVTLKIDGSEEINGDAGSMSFRNGENIYGLRVEKQLNAPNYFSAQLAMVKDEKIVFLDQRLEGKPFEVVIGYESTKGETVFKGEISYVEPTFTREGKSYLELAGYDFSHRLTRGSFSKVWGDGVQAQQKADTVVKDVVSMSGDADGGSDSLSPGGGATSNVKVPYVALYNTNLFQFARTMGFDVAADDRKAEKKILFQKIEPSKTPVLTICREREDGANAVVSVRARFQLSTIRQYKKVVVKGWDPKQKKAIVGEAKQSDYSFGGKDGYKATGKAHYGSDSAGKVYTVVDQPVNSKAEAEALAKALFNRFSMDFVTGEVEIVGNTKAEPGEVVEMKQFGKRFDGKYLIGACVHSFYPDGQGYRTTLQLSRNSQNEP
jgi:hypothetical protein